MPLFDHREFALRFADVMNRRDRESAEKMLEPGFTTDWPQSGERVRGFDNFWATIIQYPGIEVAQLPSNDAATLKTQPVDAVHLVAPTFTFVTVEGAGNAGTFTIRVTYPDGSTWWIVTIYRLRGDRMASATTFFAPEYPAPEWRAKWVERI
jgi:hypothetical protein